MRLFDALQGGQEFRAALTEACGTPVASGKDFGPDGKLLDGRKDKVVILDAGRAEQMAAALSGDQSTWKVMSLETRRQKRKPPIPFITSTLQQEANRKLGMSSKVRRGRRVGCMNISAATDESLIQHVQDGGKCDVTHILLAIVRLA